MLTNKQQHKHILVSVFYPLNEQDLTMEDMMHILFQQFACFNNPACFPLVKRNCILFIILRLNMRCFSNEKITFENSLVE